MKNGKRFAKIFVLVFCALLVLSSSAKALVYDSSGRAPDGTSWQTWGDRAVIDTFSDSPYGRNAYAGIFKQNCIMFVRLVLKLENDAGYNRGWLSSYKWDIDNAHGRELYSYGGATVVAQHRNDRHGTLTAAILEEKFSQAHTADVVQMYWNSSQHTALINGFEERNGQRGVHFFQANPTVRDNFYTFEELASKYNAPGSYGGFTIYCFGHGPGGDGPEWKNPPVPMEITSEVPGDFAIAGQYYDFQCEANGDVDVWSSAQGTPHSGSHIKTTMPPGLSINRNTGRISGTVEHTSQGKSSSSPMYYLFKIIASSSGNSAEKEACIGVFEPPVITTNSTLRNGLIGSQYDQEIKAEGTEYTMRWKLKSGSIPDGLNFEYSKNRRTARITGYPKKGGNYDFTIELCNLGKLPETTTTKNFHLAIYPLEEYPEPNFWLNGTFSDGQVGKSYSGSLSVGYARLMYLSRWIVAGSGVRVVNGSLPPGLSLSISGRNVNLTGIPRSSDVYSFKIRAVNSFGGYTEKDCTVRISPASNRIFPDPNMSIVYTLCNGSLGNTYGDYVRVSGGTSPYTVQTVSGTLPPGLTPVVEGSKIWIRGVPVRYSSTPYTFKLRATGAHNGYAEKELNIKISNNSSYSLAGAGDPDKPTKPKLLTKKLPTAAIGNEVNVQLEAYGTTPITWSCAEVPEGFIFTDTGLIMGVPMEAKNLKFKVTATNSVGSATKSFTLKVKPEKPLITTLTLPDGVAGLPYEFTPEASGTEPLTWSKSGKFPSGLKIDRKTGTISGTPKKAGTYEFKLKAKNKGGTDTVQMTIIINAEEQEKTSSVSASSFVQLRTESRGSVNTELFVIADGEDIEDDVITDAGQPLTFRTGKWVDDAGNEIEVSDVQICINDEPVNNIEAAEDGTFTLPGSYVSGEFCVSARAKYGESELETSDINVTAEAHNEEISLSDSDSSGSCSTNLFGFAGLALCALMAFRKK